MHDWNDPANHYDDDDDDDVHRARYNDDDGTADGLDEDEWEDHYNLNSEALENLAQESSEPDSEAVASTSDRGDSINTVATVDPTDLSETATALVDQQKPTVPMTMEIRNIGPATIKNLNIQMAWRTFQAYLNEGEKPTQVWKTMLMLVQQQQ